jgi:hypothetical protein
MFGLPHYFFLVDTVITAILVLLLLRRYFQQKNILSLLFTFVMLSAVEFCLTMFARGFYDANTDGSILFYRLSMIATMATPALLSIFLFYPLILEKRQAGKSGGTEVALSLVWVFALVGMALILISPAVLSHEEYSLDIYSVSFGPISYAMILAIPVLTVLINAGVIMMMAVREKERFYKMKAVLLLLGWLLILAAQLLLLIPGLLILNPLVFVLGVVVMAAAILRRAPS